MARFFAIAAIVMALIAGAAVTATILTVYPQAAHADCSGGSC